MMMNKNKNQKNYMMMMIRTVENIPALQQGDALRALYVRVTTQAKRKTSVN